jgi:hypothetical protein
MLKKFISVGLFTFGVTASAVADAEKQFAVKYLTSSSYSDIVSACSEKFPDNAESYKSALEGWLQSNALAMSKGKVIFENQVTAERPEKKPDDMIKMFNQVVTSDFANLTDKKKLQRCNFVFETLKNEQ